MNQSRPHSILSKSTVDHEAEKFVDIFFLICYDLKFRNLSAWEDVCKRYILGQFGFEVQSVTFTCYQFNFALAAVYYFKNFSMSLILDTFIVNLLSKSLFFMFNLLHFM